MTFLISSKEPVLAASGLSVTRADTVEIDRGCTRPLPSAALHSCCAFAFCHYLPRSHQISSNSAASSRHLPHSDICSLYIHLPHSYTCRSILYHHVSILFNAFILVFAIDRLKRIHDYSIIFLWSRRVAATAILLRALVASGSSIPLLLILQFDNSTTCLIHPLPYCCYSACSRKIARLPWVFVFNNTHTHSTEKQKEIDSSCWKQHSPIAPCL